jgi:vanillate O-demethylase monooxygenase subunit
MPVAAGMLQTTFQDMAARDAAVLETVQRQLADGCPLRRDLNVKADRAAVRARRSSRRC